MAGRSPIAWTSVSTSGQSCMRTQTQMAVRCAQQGSRTYQTWFGDWTSNPEL